MSTVLSSAPGALPDAVRLSIDVPDDWEQLVRDDVLVAAIRQPRAGFRSNLCVTLERVEGGIDLDEVARRTWARLAASPEFAAFGREPAEVLGLPGYRLEAGFMLPEVGAVFQLCALTTVAHAGGTDILYLVGTCGHADAAGDAELLRGIARSARFV